MDKSYLDFAGLKFFYENLANEFVQKADVDVILQQKTTDEWLAINDQVPSAGTIMVYTDRTMIDNEYVPDIKIADGKRTVGDLPFIVERNFDALIQSYREITTDTVNELYLLGASLDSDDIKRNTGITMQAGTITAELFNGIATVAKSVEHSLTIGENVYNGSADVVIPVYKGNIDQEN